MEKLRKLLFVSLSVFALSFIAVSANAQGGHNAVINPANKQITLDVNQPVSSVYTMDISSLNLRSVPAAQAYFATYVTDYVAFNFDIPNKVATMYLDYSRIADKQLSAELWNKVLKQLND